jgi:hypothetical protein
LHGDKKPIRNGLVDVPQKVWNREELLNAMKGMTKQAFSHTRIVKGSTLNNLSLEADSDYAELFDLDMTRFWCIQSAGFSL